MRKKELLKNGEIVADDGLLEMVKKELPVSEKVFGRIRYHYRYSHYMKVRQLENILQIGIYHVEHLKAGGTKPAYMIYIDKDKKDFITFDTMTGKWKTACLGRLASISSWRSIYLGQEDEERAKQYFESECQGIRSIVEFQYQVREEELLRRQKRETDAWDRDLEGVPGVPKDWNRWLDKQVISHNYIFYEYKKGGAKEGYCTWCEKMVPIQEPKYNKESVCRCCGRRIIYKAVGKCGNIFTDQETAYLIQRLGGRMILRKFAIHKHFEKGRYENPYLIQRETERYIYDGRTKTPYYYGVYKQRTARWIQGYRIWNWYNYNSAWDSPDEGKVYGRNLAGLEKSVLKKTGLRQYTAGHERMDAEGYMDTLVKIPYLEKVVKAGLNHLAEDILGAKSYYHHYRMNETPETAPGNTLTKILKLDKSRLKRLRSRDGGIEYCRWLQFEKTQGIQMDDALIDWFMDQKLQPKDLSFIKDWMSPVQVKNYLERQARELKEKVRDVLIMWSDYLSMAKRLKMDIGDEIIYRARELRRRHDEVLAEIKKRELELEKEELLEKYPLVNPVCAIFYCFVSFSRYNTTVPINKHS